MSTTTPSPQPPKGTGHEDRVAELSPERRRLLEHLASTRMGGSRATPLPQGSRIDTDRFQLDGDSLRDQDQIQRFYHTVSQQLDASPFADHARFLNYGYVANDNPQRALVQLPVGQVNRNNVRLVLELIGDSGVGPEHDVLDVGCGRGGTVTVLKAYSAPRRVVGLDLAAAAVAFCQRTHLGSNALFLQGSAEDLPFVSESFDFVTNLESSHCYGGRIQDFFADVHRVLRPAGCFLYTDLIAREDVNSHENFLAELGFVQEVRQDITSNVLLSCDETAAVHVRAFHADNDPALIDGFVGVPSSGLYEAMKNGDQRYLLYRWRKRRTQSEEARL